MKLKLILATAITGTVLALPSTSSAQAPAGDSVSGDLSGEAFFQLSLDVRSGPAGENPTGTAIWRSGGGSGVHWSVDATCLRVDGNTAVFGFSGTEIFVGIGIPIAGLARVTDGGSAPGLDSFEWAQVAGAFGGPPIPGPTDCSSYPDGFQFPFPPIVNEGDIVIIDTPALPTSKDQCRNGGWRDFPQFKNQGECIAFVNRGP